MPATAQLIASQPATLCPILEYLIKWNAIHQFFFKEPVKPIDGIVKLSDQPGMGVEIDESKVVSRKEIASAGRKQARGTSGS